MKVKIKDQEGQFTLLTIVSETVQNQGGFLKADVIKAYAYVFAKDMKLKKFLADDILEVEK